MSGQEGLGRGEWVGSPSSQDRNDDEVRALFVSLITFVAGARASHDAKNEALDAIQKLQARLLP